MLPFLKNNKDRAVGLIVSQRKPDGGMSQDDDADAGITACAEDLIRAIHAKEPRAAARALKDAFEILDSQPHEEGPHINESESE